MRKLLFGSLALTAFAIASILFQISCQKEVSAQTGNYILPPATTTTLGGVMVDGTTIRVDASGRISTTGAASQGQQGRFLYCIRTQPDNQLWTAKLDGSDARQIPITMPAGYELEMQSDVPPFVSPDGQTVIFLGQNAAGAQFIFTCRIDGSNVKKIIDLPNEEIVLGNAY